MTSKKVGNELSIKNMLFDKALPNYTVPVATNGYKIFCCTNCEDTFLFESSYNDHINRKSLNIMFFCRDCNKNIACNNRCIFLSHIKSHKLQTTSINLNNLKIEPILFQNAYIRNNSQATPLVQNEDPASTKEKHTCFECKQVIGETENCDIDREKHYMKYDTLLYSCPVCLFTLPNSCSLTAHLRIHLRIPPYYCTECGMELSDKDIIYPYNHDCKGIDMIKAVTRVKCNQLNCNKIFHPCDYRFHIISNHFTKFYKCSACLLIWDIKSKKHLPCKTIDNVTLLLECQTCSRKMSHKMDINNHINWHLKNTFEKHTDYVFPCKSCSLVCNEISSLIKHQSDRHIPKEQKDLVLKILNQYDPNVGKKLHSFTKKCVNCSKSFLCAKNVNIQLMDCPYKCYLSDSNNSVINTTKKRTYSPIICSLCDLKISEKWGDIKKHYGQFHKKHKCIDIKVMLKRIDKRFLLANKKDNETLLITKNSLKKTSIRTSKLLFNDKPLKLNSSKDESNENVVCSICNLRCQNKQTLETHIITHRDPCMAYQCLECGQSFVVKPSFSTHLLLEHGIVNVTEYINNKKCFNKSALLKLKPNCIEMQNEPVKENQCIICRDQFNNIDELEKHFRVHGMAFLMKYTNKNHSL